MLKSLNTKLLTKPGAPALSKEATPIFELHPLQISGFLEATWEAWRLITNANPPFGLLANKESLRKMPRALVLALGEVEFGVQNSPPQKTVDVDGPIAQLLRSTGDGALNTQVKNAAVAVLRDMVYDVKDEGKTVTQADPVRHWEHLIYAYLIENTRVLEVCRKLVEDLLSDEIHGAMSDGTYQWLRTTEDLFFRNGNSSFIPSVTSWIRSDDGATRRNAYHRMFGIDLNHGYPDGRPFTYRKATIANTEFISTFQDLLRELWRGYVNATNTSGTNTTDDTNISELIDRLQSMLNSRRLGEGNLLTNLAREEFVSVNTMAWFELSIFGESPIVKDLKATGSNPEDRLRLIAERVKVPMHSKSRSFFILAKHLPRLLTLIEEGHFEEPKRGNIKALYSAIEITPGVKSTELRDAVLQIINHWSIATGVDLKAVPTTTGPR